jgi:sterol desaturase/sphingolipid hydroxylase (fatty acid hydroxylase superfamily)
MKQFLKYTAYPLIVVLSLGAYALLREYGLSAGLSVFLASVVNMVMIGLSEIIIPLRPEWSLFKDWQSPNDILHAIFSTEFAGRIPRLILATLSVSLTAYLSQKNIVGLWPAHWHIAWQFILVIVISEVIFYWQHRMFHSGFFWRFHALHHNAEQMHVLKSGRLHAGEIMVRILVLNLPFVIMGAPGEMVFAYGIFGNTIGNLAHGNIDVKLPEFIHYVLVTPVIHHAHHAIDASFRNSNFSGAFTFMDIIFGTFKIPEKGIPITPGITEDFYPKFWLWQIFAPLLPNAIFDRKKPQAAP